jgi:hypothetical protein
MRNKGVNLAAATIAFAVIVPISGFLVVAGGTARSAASTIAQADGSTTAQTGATPPANDPWD